MNDGDPLIARFAGAAESPVIVHVPHAGTHVPAEVGAQMTVTAEELQWEIDQLTDAHTDGIARRVAGAASAAPHVIVNRLSRFVVDPERFPGDSEEMNAVGMGAVYSKGVDGRVLRSDNKAHEAALLDSYYWPWARAMEDEVKQRLHAVGRCVIVDLHSYPTVALPYELHSEGPRPRICLGVDDFHTSMRVADIARDCLAPMQDVQVNTPFAGAYVPSAFFKRDERVQAVMIEIRRDVYMQEPGGSTTEGLDELCRCLTSLVDELTSVGSSATE